MKEKHKNDNKREKNIVKSYALVMSLLRVCLNAFTKECDCLKGTVPERGGERGLN